MDGEPCWIVLAPDGTAVNVSVKRNVRLADDAAADPNLPVLDVPPGHTLDEDIYRLSPRGSLVPSRDYRTLRRDSYPDIGDQLDALWKGVRSIVAADPAAGPVLAQIEAVKARFQKPT